MINKGNGFIKLPLVLDSATTTGSGSSLFAVSNVTPMVGNVEGIEVTNFGLDYTSNPSLTLNRNVLVRNISGSFTVGDALVSHTGTVVSFDSSRNILELKTSVTLNEGDVITTSTGATATVHQSTPSFANATVGTVGTTVGNFVGDSGKVSVDTMRVQDSFYYQDYSYVVRIGQSINEWRESVRRSVHPAGWNVFGEVSFASQVSARLQVPTAGQVVDYTGDTETFSPELASTFTNLFTTIFGRRLGTATDGTSVNASAKVGLKDLSERQSGKREVTLTSAVTVSMGLTSQTSNTLGPTLDLLPKYAFAVPPIETTEVIPNYPGIQRQIRNSNSGAYFTIEQFGQFRINQVSARGGENTFDYASSVHNTFDSTQDTFDSQSIFIPSAAFTTRINVPPPGEIVISDTGSVNAFDQTFVTFDNAIETFDEAGSGSSRATAGGVYTDYSETTSTYDDTNTTFDVGV